MEWQMSLSGAGDYHFDLDAKWIEQEAKRLGLRLDSASTEAQQLGRIAVGHLFFTRRRLKTAAAVKASHSGQFSLQGSERHQKGGLYRDWIPRVDDFRRGRKFGAKQPGR
jgi:hypothetical protein